MEGAPNKRLYVHICETLPVPSRCVIWSCIYAQVCLQLSCSPHRQLSWAQLMRVRHSIVAEQMEPQSHLELRQDKESRKILSVWVWGHRSSDGLGIFYAEWGWGHKLHCSVRGTVFFGPGDPSNISGVMLYLLPPT